MTLGLLDAAQSGAGHTLLIEGDAGIGKTRLVQELVAVASSRSMRVVQAAGDPVTSVRPFHVIAEALGEGSDPGKADEDDKAEPASSPNGKTALVLAPGAQFRIIEDLGAAVEEMATAGPLLVVLEDLHWADASTALALRSVARRIGQLPVLIVGTTRPDHAVVELHRLTEDLVQGGDTHLVLGPLDPDSVARLVGGVVGAVPGKGLLERVQGAAGNPLLVTEYSHALAADSLIDVEDGIAEVRDPGVPLEFQRTVLRRLAQLPDQTNNLIRMSSVLGSTFSPGDLVTVLGRSAVEIADALQSGVAAGLIGERGERLAFAHDLVRDAVYESIPVPFRRQLHREFARSLADAGARPLVVAHHLELAAEERDPEATAWLLTAARQVASRAPGVAVELLQRALDLAGPAAPDREALLTEMVLPLAWSGRLREAEEIGKDVLSRHLSPSSAGALRCGLAYAAAWQGRPREALEYAVVDPTEKLGDSDETLLRAHGAVARMFSFDLQGAATEARVAADAATRIGHDGALCTALGVQTFLAAFSGATPEAIELGRRAVEFADRSEDGDGHLANPRFFLGLPLLAADRLDEAEKVLQHGRQIAEELGHGWSLPLYHAYLGTRRFVAGEWDDAIAEYEASLRIADEVGVRMIVFIAVTAWLTVIRVHRDELERAEETLALARTRVAEAGPQIGMSLLAWANALVLEARGEDETALLSLRQAWDFSVGAGLHAEPWSGAALLRLYARAGRLQEATDMVPIFEEQATKNPTQFMRGRALEARGLVEADPDLLLAAVAAYRESPRPHELALACEDAGRVLAASDRVEDAVALLDEAISLYERLGSVRDSARARSTLRKLGVTRGARQRRVRAMTGWDSLTPTELKVVSLVGKRLSNPEVAERLFISRHTVESHLKHVYAKLGLASRIQLAAEVEGRDRSHS